MQVFDVPARNDLPNYKFTINLSGTQFQLSFYFNVRMNRWLVDVNDPAGNQILSGTPILIARALFNQYITLNLPVGTMFATDDTNKDTQPTQFSFGTDHTLLYVDPTQ